MSILRCVETYTSIDAMDSAISTDGQCKILPGYLGSYRIIDVHEYRELRVDKLNVGCYGEKQLPWIPYEAISIC